MVDNRIAACVILPVRIFACQSGDSAIIMVGRVFALLVWHISDRAIVMVGRVPAGRKVVYGRVNWPAPPYHCRETRKRNCDYEKQRKKNVNERGQLLDLLRDAGIWGSGACTRQACGGRHG